MSASSSTPPPIPTTVSVSGVVGAAIAVAEAVAATVEAYIGAGVGRIGGGDPSADIVITGDVDVIAASDVDASAHGARCRGGRRDLVEPLIPTAWATGVAELAGDRLDLQAASFDVLADSDVKAYAQTFQIAVGLLGAGNGGSAEAVVASDTEAFIGRQAEYAGSGRAPSSFATSPG